MNAFDDVDDLEDENSAPAPEVLEHFFSCPYCGAHISMLLDSSVAQQSFVEDCEICCNGIEVTYRFDGGQLIDFRVMAES